MAGGSLADVNYWRLVRSSASHAARCVASHGVGSQLVPVALVGERIGHFNLNISSSRDSRPPVLNANSSLIMCLTSGEYHSVWSQEVPSEPVLELQQSIRIVENVPAGTVRVSSLSAMHCRSM
jgi:hypothetical protein